jgi:nicotinamide mononucleotide transporter
LDEIWTIITQQGRALFHNRLEITAVILGLISVYLVVRRNVLTFPIGIAMVAMYAIIFYEAKLYSDMLLQVFFVVMQALGWYQWLYGSKDSDQKIKVRNLNSRQMAITSLIILSGTGILGFTMDRYTDTDVPYPDAFTTLISVMAQWWLNKGYLQNWSLWIFVNILYIGLYWYKTLYLTSFLYLFFLVLAILGYREWKSKLAATR